MLVVDTTKQHGRRSGGRSLLIYAGVAVGALFLLLVLGLTFMDWNLLKGPIQRAASASLGRAVRIAGPIQVRVWSRRPMVTVTGLTIGNPVWEANRPMAKVERVRVELEPAALLRGHIVLHRVEVLRPEIYLHQEKSGRANWTFENKAPTKAPKARTSEPTSLPAIRDLVVQSGSLVLIDELRRLEVKGTIVAAEQPSRQSPKPFRIEGQGTINKEPFKVDIAGGPLRVLSPERPYPFSLSILAGQSHLAADCRVLRPFDLAGLDLQMNIQGRDLAELFYLTQIAMPNSPPFRLRALIQRRGMQFAIRQLSGSLGGSDVSGTIDIDASVKRPNVRADLVSRHLYMQDFAAITGNKAQDPSTSLDKPGSGAAAQKSSKPPTPKAAKQLFPDSHLQVDRLRAVDADLRFRATSIEAGNVPFRRINLHTKLENGVLMLDPLQFEMAQGRLDGHVRIDAHAGTPQVQVDFRAANIRLSQFKPKKPNAVAPVDGTLDARARIEGKGDSVHNLMADATGRLTAVVPEGNVGSAFAELTGVDVAKGIGLLVKGPTERAPIRCGVAQFDVNHGTARTQDVIFDTKDVLITGKGQIHLGPEKLDLAIEGQPKKLRITRIRAPVEIKGRLLKPSFGLEPGHAIKQGGIAAALGTLLTPIASVFAFVDPGLAKDQNCAQLLAQVQPRPPSMK